MCPPNAPCESCQREGALFRPKMGQPNSPTSQHAATLLQHETQRAARLIERHHPPWRVEYHATLDSTQSEALRRITSQNPPKHPFLLVAEHQQEGQGRHGRQWNAPPGTALLFTAATPLSRAGRGAADPHNGNYPLSLWPLQIGMALFVRLWSFGWHAALKWPNDVLVERHKAAGILCQVRSGWLLAGIGVNLLQREQDFAAVSDARVPPGSLAMFSREGCPAPEQMAPTLLQSAVSILEAPWETGRMMFFYRKWCTTIGETFRLEDGRHAVAKDIDPDGRLIVETNQGEIEHLSGELPAAKGAANEHA